MENVESHILAPSHRTYDFWKAVLVELLATALFCYVGIGTAV